MDIQLIVEMLKNNRALWVTATVTGVFAIIVSILNAIWSFIQRKKQLEYDKQLEKYKHIAEKKNYVSKVRFDAEFAIYRDLSKVFFNMVLEIGALIPPGYSERPVDEEQYKKLQEESFRSSAKAHKIAQETLFQNAPFIPEELYNDFRELLQLTRLQLAAYKMRFNVLYVAPKEEKESYSKEDYKRAGEINSKFDALNKKIREYLASLDVAE